MPETINNIKNFLLPIRFSSINPKNISEKRLYNKWSRLECKNIAVTNLQGSIKALEVKINEFVKPENKSCTTKIPTIAIQIHKLKYFLSEFFIVHN